MLYLDQDFVLLHIILLETFNNMIYKLGMSCAKLRSSNVVMNYNMILTSLILALPFI